MDLTMFEFLSQSNTNEAVEALHFALQRITHRQLLGLKSSQLELRPAQELISRDEIRLGQEVLKEIERTEKVPLQDLSPARAYYYKNLLAELAQDRTKLAMEYNVQTGRDLLARWRNQPLREVSKITLPWPLARWQKWALAVYLMSGTLATIYLTYTLFRNLTPDSSGTVIAGFIHVTPETRLILLAISSGTLGALIQAIRTFTSYVGNRTLFTNSVGQLLLQPFLGMSLALVGYWVLRSGILSPSAPVQDISLYSVAATSALIGMFSPNVATKFGEIADTIFRSSTDKT